MRTNSESILALTMPDDSMKMWNTVAISSSVHTDEDTHIEVVTYGRHGDFMSLLLTVLTGDGTRWTRIFAWLRSIVRHPLRFLRTLWPFGWSRRTIMLLVMQSLDNAIHFRAKKRWFGRGVRLSSEQHSENPNPTYIDAGNKAAEWLASKYGAMPQSFILEATLNIPTTAHILGGAAIGRDAEHGVIDSEQRVFGYENLMICDGSAVPANPGVNPSLTIAAMTERAMSKIPGKQPHAD